MRHIILVSSLFAAGLLTSAVAGQSTLPTGKVPIPAAVQGKATTAAPQSRMEGDEAMDHAVAAAVIGAVTGQFGDRKVGVKLDSVDVDPSSIRDRAVAGEGRLQIGDDAEWLPFRFKAQYDTQAASVSYPSLVIGGADGADTVETDAPMSKALLAHVDGVVSREFAGQPVVIAFDQVKTVSAGKRFLRVEAIGMADFRAEGTTPASVQALYDRKTGDWVNVAYELGSTANWADAPVATAH